MQLLLAIWMNVSCIITKDMSISYIMLFSYLQGCWNTAPIARQVYYIFSSVTHLSIQGVCKEKFKLKLCLCNGIHILWLMYIFSNIWVNKQFSSNYKSRKIEPTTKKMFTEDRRKRILTKFSALRLRENSWAFLPSSWHVHWTYFECNPAMYNFCKYFYFFMKLIFVNINNILLCWSMWFLVP